ncbi:MAG: efflux RND transporter periplasmic adaptor subunit, partial [Legionellales bacterium]
TLGIIFLVIIALYYVFSTWYYRNQPVILYGNVDIRDVNLGFRVSGRLLVLNVDEGDPVHRGEFIARLDPDPYLREVNSAKAAVNQQKATLAYAETVYAREKRLYGTGASSIDRYQNALTSRDAAKATLDKSIADLSQSTLRLEDTYLYSPSDGEVLTRAVEPGTMLAVNAPVITVSLVNPVWVRAYIAETELSKAKQGTHVTVYSDSHPDKVYDGQIGFVSPTAEFTPKNVETTDLRTQLVYRLRIIMQDPNHELRQGMPVTVQLVKGNDHVENKK